MSRARGHDPAQGARLLIDLENALDGREPAADWPSFRAVSWIFSLDGKRSRILAAAAAPRPPRTRACVRSTDWFHATENRPTD